MKDMDDDKKPLGKVLPENEKDRRDEYSDSMKSPLHGIEDKKETLDEAFEEE